AVRRVSRERSGCRIVTGPRGLIKFLTFGQLGVKRPPLTRRRGRQWYDNWIRDLEICFLIALACGRFGLQPTRSREARRANRIPSGISVVVAALVRNGINIEEASVQRHIWLGLPGEIARYVVMKRAMPN